MRACARVRRLAPLAWDHATRHLWSCPPTAPAPRPPPLQDLWGFVLVNGGTLLFCASVFMLLVVAFKVQKVI